MIWDISFMVIGFVLGGDVGIVTILVAFFSGSDYNMDAEKNGGTNCIDDRA